jgi:hypothetical protein
VDGVGIYRGNLGLSDLLDGLRPLDWIYSYLKWTFIGFNRKNCEGSHKIGLGPKPKNIRREPQRVMMVARH